MTEEEIAREAELRDWCATAGMTLQDLRRVVDGLSDQIDRDSYALAVQAQPPGSVMRTVGRHSLDA